MQAIETKIGFIPAAEDLRGMEGRAVALNGAHPEHSKNGLWQLPRTQKPKGIISTGCIALDNPAVTILGVCSVMLSPTSGEVIPGLSLTPDEDGFLVPGGSFATCLGHSLGGGMVPALIMPSGGGSGGIFITGMVVSPNGTVITLEDDDDDDTTAAPTITSDGTGAVTLTYKDNLSSVGALTNKVIDEATFVSPVIRVTAEWEGGGDDYVGTAFINGVIIPVANITQIDQRRYQGWVDVFVTDSTGTGTTSISASHSGGARSSVTALIGGPGPVLLSIEIQGSYPTGSNSGVVQTEYRAGQQVQLLLTFEDPDITASNLGIPSERVLPATQANVKAVSAGASQQHAIVLDGSFQATITTSIGVSGNLGNSPAQGFFRVSGSNSAGTEGTTIDSNTAASIEHTNWVYINDQAPTRGASSITYPATQGALKDNEEATVTMAVTFMDQISYLTPLNQLNAVPANTVYSQDKAVTRLAGDYNVTSPNYQVRAIRNANDALSTFNSVVFIADATALLQVSETAPNLRSGGNHGTAAQQYPITVASNQIMITTPTMALGHTPVSGSFTTFNGTTTAWSSTLSVHDADPKGNFVWGAISCFNLARRESTSITGDANYRLAGFVLRTLTVGAFARTTDIGTRVFDTSRLSCQINSTGNPGTFSSVQVTTNLPDVGQVDGFTITNEGTQSNTGSDWWHNDNAQVQGNAAGTTITLEET